MPRIRFGAGFRLRSGVLGFVAAAAAVVFSGAPADAAHRRHHAKDSYAPLFASIVVDGNTGQVLYAANADASCHPASLTKIMTLYLLFERLDAGRIRLDTPLRISEHAAEQAPTKLGLKVGQTISVEDAIKAVVTKSANDAAVAIAENLAGNESAFAKLMTQKAHALGMSRTTYVNASGLPDDDQVTTARDEALLGRAIQERFPRYYKYFSTTDFVYRGRAIHNHNHLLGEVVGVDGIKTGYTRSSGFNLVTSVHRDGRYIVAVVLGGRSAVARDARMRALINAHIKEAALHRTAPLLAENADPQDAPAGRTSAKTQMPAARSDPPVAAANDVLMVGSTDAIQPVLVRTIPYHIVPQPTAALAPMPALVADPGAPAQPSASAQGRPLPPAPAAKTADGVVVASTEFPAIGDHAYLRAAKPDTTKTDPAPAPVHAHDGWLIQIGAFDDEDEARQHLNAAELKVRTVLAAADAFTERVQKGDKAFYRARFAGFDRATAEATCKLLKRNAISCMALKD